MSKESPSGEIFNNFVLMSGQYCILLLSEQIHEYGILNLSGLSNYHTDWKMKGLGNKTFQRKNVNIFLPISYSICFGCSKEPSHRDGSLEYPQHMFWWRNNKN